MRQRTTFVYVYLTEGPVPAGRLDMIEDGRNSHAVFQYGRRYLQRHDRVAIDPAALPLPDPEASDQTFRTAPDFALFNGIRDASPDGWGRYLIAKAAGAETLEEFDYLIASGDHRVGALAFGPDPTNGPKRITPWGDGAMAGEHLDLAGLLEAAERVQSVDRLDPELRRFLEAGSSLGGARPKAATTRNGTPWIAKFSAKDDTYPVCRVEHATMTLAAECGLNVPRLALESVFHRDVYLIERFDRFVRDGKTGRRSFASALTMLEAQEIAAYHYSYRDLAEVLRQYGTEPKQDLRELFRRMVFNILVSNDDDHLRNHAFLFDGRGWRLSPLYDVVPRPQAGPHTNLILGVGDKGREASLQNALSGIAAFGLSGDEAVRLIEDLRLRVKGRWRHLLTENKIKPDDVTRLTSCFAKSENDRWQNGGG
jgi:serine/threonine-protein kinase HipA